MQLLEPIEHRSADAQADLAVIRGRDVLVQTRTKLINSVRGTAKSFGCRLPSCATSAFAKKVKDELPDVLVPALRPLLDVLDEVTARIKAYDRAIEQIARASYPQTDAPEHRRCRATHLACVCPHLDEPARFKKSRDVGASSDSHRNGFNLTRPIGSAGSPKRATRTCGACSSTARITYSDRSARTATCGNGVWPSRSAAVRTARGAQWWRLQGNLRC